MKTKESNPTGGKWTHSTKLMNNNTYTTSERTFKGKSWTCYRSEKEELCVDAPSLYAILSAVN